MKVGSVVYARVAVANKDMETELVCTSATNKGAFLLPHIKVRAYRVMKEMDLVNSLAATYLNALSASQEGAHLNPMIEHAHSFYYYRLLYQTNPVLNALGKRIPCALRNRVLPCSPGCTAMK